MESFARVFEEVFAEEAGIVPELPLDVIQKCRGLENGVELPARREFADPEDPIDGICGSVSMRLSPVILLPAILLVVFCLPKKLNAQTTASGGLTGVVTIRAVRSFPM